MTPDELAKKEKEFDREDRQLMKDIFGQAMPDDDDDDDDEPVPVGSSPLVDSGKMVQYTSKKGMYVPTTPTVQSLPPDVYSIEDEYEGRQHFLGLKPLKLTTDNLIHFKGGPIDGVMEDINRFWGFKEAYKKIGFSHKRGYLLYGPPGSGKTCLITLIVKDIVGKGGVAFFSNNIHGLASMLPQFRSVEPDRQLVVILEDIDSMINHPGIESALLSMMDGELSVENIAFVGTTNYPEVLDKRFLNRPGRFDKVVNVALPDKTIREQYLINRIGSTKTDKGDDLLELSDTLSLGHLRELIVEVLIYGKDAKQVSDDLKKMKSTPKSDGGKTGFGFDKKKIEEDF